MELALIWSACQRCLCTQYRFFVIEILNLLLSTKLSIINHFAAKTVHPDRTHLSSAAASRPLMIRSHRLRLRNRNDPFVLARLRQSQHLANGHMPFLTGLTSLSGLEHHKNSAWRTLPLKFLTKFPDEWLPSEKSTFRYDAKCMRWRWQVSLTMS